MSEITECYITILMVGNDDKRKTPYFADMELK